MSSLVPACSFFVPPLAALLHWVAIVVVTRVVAGVMTVAVGMQMSPMKVASNARVVPEPALRRTR